MKMVAKTETVKTRRRRARAPEPSNAKLKSKSKGNKKSKANGELTEAEQLPKDTIAKAKTAEADAAKAKKKAEAAKAKAKKEAEAERLKKTTLDSLSKTAKDINARFVKIENYLGRADDHRLAAAINIANAKERCRDARIPFKDWCKDHLKLPAKKEGGPVRLLSYETIRKLLPVGLAEAKEEGAGQKLLEDMRAKNKLANKEYRERTEAEKKAEEEAAAKRKEAAEAPPSEDKVRVQLDKMDDDARKEMLDKSNQMGVPVIDISGDIVVGFNEPKLRELLEVA